MKNLSLYLLFAFLISCSGNQKPQSRAYKQKAIDLQDRASALIIRAKTDSALLLLDQAIRADRSYYIPHISKSGIYIQQKAYDKALTEIEIAIRKNPDYAEGWVIKGFIQEIIENKEEATKCYKKSITMFTERINDPSKKEQYLPNLMNRALSAKLAGDESYHADFEELRKSGQQNEFVNHFIDKTNSEIIQEFFKLK